MTEGHGDDNLSRLNGIDGRYLQGIAEFRKRLGPQFEQLSKVINRVTADMAEIARQISIDPLPSLNVTVRPQPVYVSATCPSPALMVEEMPIARTRLTDEQVATFVTFIAALLATAGALGSAAGVVEGRWNYVLQYWIILLWLTRDEFQREA